MFKKKFIFLYGNRCKNEKNSEKSVKKRCVFFSSQAGKRISQNLVTEFVFDSQARKRKKIHKKTCFFHFFLHLGHHTTVSFGRELIGHTLPPWGNLPYKNSGNLSIIQLTLEKSSLHYKNPNNLTKIQFTLQDPKNLTKIPLIIQKFE